MGWVEVSGLSPPPRGGDDDPIYDMEGGMGLSPRGEGTPDSGGRAAVDADLSPPRGGVSAPVAQRRSTGTPLSPTGRGLRAGWTGTVVPAPRSPPRGEGTGSRTGIAWHASHPARRTHASAALRGPTRTASITHELWRHSVINLRRRLRKPDRPIAPAQGDVSAPTTGRPAFFPATTPLRMCRPKLARRRAPEAPPCTYGEA